MNPIPQTQNTLYGFYGTVACAGWDAEYCWTQAICAISNISHHPHDGDIAIFLDSKMGRWLAEYMLADSSLEEAPIACRIKEAVLYWMRQHPDAEMLAAGAPKSTPYLVAALAMIARQR